MSGREDAIRRFVEQYAIDVPEERVENELQYITLEMRHRMQYDALTGGGPHLFPGAELAGQEEELRRTAYYEAKSDLVFRAVIREQGFTASREELEQEAADIARRQDTTVALVKDFFGEDLAMLERSVQERKAADWMCAQMGDAEP